jgi:acyl-CoA reductase-like NAD-dependent aldehyde dehydrogenase
MPTHIVINPYDGSTVCELEIDQGAGLDRKVDRAAAAKPAWRAVPLGERVRQVTAALGYFTDRREEIARDVTRQMGKPIVEARREVDTMLARARHMIAIAPAALAADAPEAPPGLELRIEHEPLGVVLDVAAWNYPLLIPVNVVVPALLAGNVVLLKHSGKTPLCGRHFARAFAGLSVPSVVTDLVLTHADTAALVKDPRVDHVAFTGSVRGGHEIQQAASGRFLDVGLELGGKDPAYVAEDTDLDAAVAGIVDGACYDAGQSCCAVERVYVHRKHYGAFLAKAEAAMREYVLGDPLAEATTMGPLASRDAVDLLERQVADAVRRGARLIAGGRRLPTHPGFFPPTLLADCAQDSLIMQEESFGPTLPARAVADDAEAVRLMNDSRYGLTASVWTKSADRARWFAERLEAGTIYQNRCDFLEPALPWTGVKDSGRGSTLSRYGFLHLTRRKSLNFRK